MNIVGNFINGTENERDEVFWQNLTIPVICGGEWTLPTEDKKRYHTILLLIYFPSVGQKTDYT